jgi:hypothetical protein
MFGRASVLGQRTGPSTTRRFALALALALLAGCAPRRHVTIVDTTSLPFEDNPSKFPVISPPALPRLPISPADAGTAPKPRTDAAMSTRIDDAGSDDDAGS